MKCKGKLGAVESWLGSGVIIYRSMQTAHDDRCRFLCIVYWTWFKIDW